MKANVEIAFVACCDLIRREDSGKLIAIGIYGENIRFSAAPTPINLSFLIWAVAQEIGEYEADIDIYLEPQQKQVASFKLGFTSTSPASTLVFPVPPVPLNVGGKGALVLKQKKEGGMKEIFRLPILVTDPDNAIA